MLSILIVSWNVRDLLRDCLRSIARGRGDLDVEVIVVDSASADGSAAMVAAEFPWVTLLPQTDNVGFPRGNNIALARARGDYLLLLNPDTVVLDDALPVLVDYLRSHPDVGAVGPQLLNPDGSVQSSRRRFPTLATGFLESTWLEGLAPGVLRRYYALDLLDDATAEVEWLVGACLMVPRAVYERVGGLDNGYFMYSEELDWCRRIVAAGWRVVYHPAARVIHHVGKSSEQAVTARHINFQRAKLRYFRKHHGRLTAAALRLFLLGSYGWQLLLEATKGALGSQPALRRQRVRAYRDVLRSGLRPAGYWAMRVGLVTGEYPPLEGGVGAFTEQLARALHGRGHEVHVITTKRARPADAPRTASALFEPLALDYGWLHPRIGRWRWPSLSTVADIVVRHELEIVNVQYQAAAYNMRAAAIHYLPWRLRGVAPMVVTFHDLRVPYLFPKAGGLRAAAVRGLARRAAGAIATNAADLDTLRGWTDAPLRQIPIGSNIDAYEPNHIEIAEVRDGLGLKPGDVLLGYFGFLNETKGADTLLDALARLDDRHHLVFIGGQKGASDPRNNEAFLGGLRQQIERLGLGGRVHWTGFLSPRRVSAHLAAADLMVMPYRDGVSLRRGTLMAVLAHGRPLLTTAPAAPTPELRQGENMWLVPPDDPAALAEAIAALAADPAQRAQLGRGARALAGLFDWGRIAGLTADFYAEIVAEKALTQRR